MELNNRLFSLLRLGVGIKENIEKPALDEVLWKSIFALAEKQAVTGVVFQGINKLPKEKQPPKDILMKWFAKYMQIKKANIFINRNAIELGNLLNKNGFRYCILKGQGNAALYNDKYSRMPGDIDIWVNADRKTIVDFVKSNFQPGEMRFHHIEFDYINTSVEMHFFPLYMNNTFYNRRLQKWFKECVDEQCNNWIDLPDEIGKIPAPTNVFNATYQMGHIFHHFFDEGIGLRQIMDYFYVLKSLNSKDRNFVREKLRYFGMDKFASAVMYVEQKVFGLEDEFLIVSPDKKRGENLLDEIMNGGNFGKHFTKYNGFTRKSATKKYFLKIYRNLQLAKQYPAEALCEPLFRTWHFFWRINNKIKI